MLGLTPTEFRRLTCSEFQAMLAARLDYDKQWRWFFAAMTANLMNAGGHMDTPIQPADLLGPDAKEEAVRAQARALAEKKHGAPCL